MNGNHVAGGTLAGLITFAAARFGWTVSDPEALALAAAAVTVGGVLAHVFTGPGLVPAVKRALFGTSGAK